MFHLIFKQQFLSSKMDTSYRSISLPKHSKCIEHIPSWISIGYKPYTYRLIKITLQNANNFGAQLGRFIRF